MQVFGWPGGVVPFSTQDDLPGLVVRANASVASLSADLADVVRRVADTTGRVRDLLDVGAHTERDIRQLQADLTGTLADIAELRTALDDFRGIEALVYIDGASLVETWRWERDTRSQLVALARQVQAVRDLVAELADGRANRTVLTRSGDTWQGLAQRHLGDWREWPRLAAANDGDPAEVTPGTLIRIPETR